jgi:broad specificity phosphatase PhoE
MKQAAEACAPRVDVVLVSPLLRTLQTASIMFPDTPHVALECLKEYPQDSHVSNKRSSTSLLKRLYPRVDFTDLREEEQPWPNPVNHDQNVQIVKDLIRLHPGRQFAIVSHSTWLRFWLNGTLDDKPVLEHCKSYDLPLF